MIRDYLRTKGISYKEVARPSGAQALYPCPKCGENKFAVSLDTGAFQCFRNNECGFKGSWWELQKHYGDTPKQNKNNYFLKTDKREYKKPEVKAVNPNGEALQWLKGRGFTPEIIKYFKVGITADGLSIMLPSFQDGVLKNIKYRSIKEKKFWNEKDAEPILFGMDNITGTTLYITEGHFDAIAAKHYNLDAVSVPNGSNDLNWIEICWDWLDKFKKIYLIFDNDKAGQDNILKIVNRLGKHRCYNVLLPEKDLNDCLIKKLPAQVINESILQAREFYHPDIVTADFFADALVSSFKTIEYSGITTGINGLDVILKGWREKEVTLWTGNNGSGKSTMLNWIILNILKNGGMCCIASLEMHAVKYLRWMITQFFKIQPSEEQIFEFLQLHGGRLLIYNSTRPTVPKELFEAFEFAAKKYGADNFFVDSLMKIRFTSKDEYRDQKEFCSDMSDFAKEHRAHFHLVAHPRKGNNDDRQPDKVDVSGSGHITDLVDNVIVMWRTDEKTKEKQNFDNMLMVKKNREFGKLGNVYFNFNEDNKNLIEIENLNNKKPEIFKNQTFVNPDYFND
jgi:twinkle protein